MKKLPNGNYELTRNELFALIKDSEELYALYYAGTQRWWDKHQETYHEYISKHLRNLGVKCSKDEPYGLSTLADTIIDKIE